MQDEVLYFSIDSGEPVIILDGIHFVRGNGHFGAVNLLAEGSTFMKTSVFDCSITQSQTGDFGSVLEMHNWNTSESDRTIANTLIAGNAASGIYSQITDDTIAHWRIINTTISNNNLSGGGQDGYGIEAFTLDNGALTAHIYNSIVWGNEQDDLSFWWNITFEVDHSDICNVDTLGGAIYLPGDGVMCNDPLFVGGYRLSNFSPCIGAGIGEGVPSIDIEGNPRPDPAGSNPDIGAYERSLGVPLLQITGISPDKGGNTGSVTLTISGSSLDPNAEVKLTKTGEPDIIAAFVTGSSNGTRLTAAFDLNGKTPGIWNLVVTNPGGDSATLPNAFTIEAGGEARFWVSAAVPNTMRPGRVTTVMISCGNSGSVDLQHGLIGIKVDGAILDSPCASAFEEKPAAFSESELFFIVFHIPAGSVHSFPVFVRPTGSSPIMLNVFATQDMEPFESPSQTTSLFLDTNLTSLSAAMPMLVVTERPWKGYEVDLRKGSTPPPDGSLIFNSGVTAHVGTCVQIDGEWYMAENMPGLEEKWTNKGYPSDGSMLFRWEDYKERVRGKAAAIYVPTDLNSEQLKNAPGGLKYWLVRNTWSHNYNGDPKLYLRPWYKCTEFILDAFEYAGRPLVLIRPDALMTPAEMYLQLTGELMPFLWPNVVFGLRLVIMGNIVVPIWFVNTVYQSSVVTPYDPNDKMGSAGYDPAGTPEDQRKHFIRADGPFPYMIHFENLETATAAAQEVLMTDQFDSNLDWSTFSLGMMQIGEKTVMVPEGAQNFTTTLDLRPAIPAVVDVDCSFNPSTGRAEWLFRGKDPYTGELADFLPPNKEDVAPRGEGWVSYSVKPKADLATGTVIRNMATIDFEIDIPPDPMDTPEVFNTIDSGAPASQVKPLPVSVSSTTFTVEWEGEDDANGSGLKDYAIYVSEDDMVYTKWLSHTTQTSASFSGEQGHTYHFYSRAEDNVGNVEEAPLEADAMTTVALGIAWEMEVAKGWCLISLPLEPTDTDPSVVLSSIDTKYNSVWAYDPDEGWSIYAPGAPSDLEEMIPGEGYWLKMEEPGTFTIQGTAPESTAIFLEGAAWNLVGYGSLESRNAGECMSSVANDINSVWEYGPHDAVVKSWSIYALGAPSDLEVMKPGYGYWIKADQGCTWDINAPITAAPPLIVESRRNSVAEDRPDIPYRLWGSVEIDGMKMKSGGIEQQASMVVLKVDNEVQARYTLGSVERYGNLYMLDVPASTDNPAQAELYVKVDDELIKAAPVPPGEPGQMIRLDLSVRIPPKVSMLHQNYPNPFNPDTWIPYQLSDDADVLIKIYTSAGELVRMLNLGHKPAGFYADKGKAAYWDGKNEAGEHVASGVYFYSIKAGDFTDTRKMVIVR